MGNASIAPAGLSALQDSADRTFAASLFRHCYNNTPAPRGSMTLGAALKELLRAYCVQETIPWQGQDGGNDFFEQLQAEAMASSRMRRRSPSRLSACGHRRWSFEAASSASS